MASKALIEKIEALPAEKKAQVEDFVEFLARRSEVRPPSGAPRFPKELLDRITAEREALYREQGPIDTDPILRDLREHGGR